MAIFVIGGYLLDMAVFVVLPGRLPLFCFGVDFLRLAGLRLI